MPRETMDCQRGARPLAVCPGRLLIVCEDLEDLRHYGAILQQQGYKTCCLTSFEQGVARLRREDFDLVIVSQGSPDFEGRAVVASAIERNRHTPVLVLARCIDISCYLEAMQLGAVDYLEKPESPLELAKWVEMHVQSRARAA